MSKSGFSKGMWLRKHVGRAVIFGVAKNKVLLFLTKPNQSVKNHLCRKEIKTREKNSAMGQILWPRPNKQWIQPRKALRARETQRSTGAVDEKIDGREAVFFLPQCMHAQRARGAMGAHLGLGSDGG